MKAVGRFSWTIRLQSSCRRKRRESVHSVFLWHSCVISPK